ncbi:MAG: ACP S-malonyltransferase [Deltaproteobacteria bacterium]|nr:ACP S-malonyltransferase [Deltaproteobacteria bacterium]
MAGSFFIGGWAVFIEERGMNEGVRYIGLFPGQGSQKLGMGKELLHSELARDLFSRADSALGLPLSTICFEGPEERLTATEIAQPAILTVSSILFAMFMQKQGGLLPVAAAGHSLGEYSALVAAGAIEFDDAVLLVHKRGRYMQEAVAAGEGAMYAVLGKEIGEVEEALAKLAGVAEIANVNAPGQIVVSGQKSSFNNLKEVLPGTRIIELQVSAPFHCSLMKPAQDSLEKDLAALSIKPPKFPIYANYSAKEVSSPEDIRRSLALQVCGRVRWTESIQAALSKYALERVLEFGHGNVLTGLMKRIDPKIGRINIDSQQSIDSFS